MTTVPPKMRAWTYTKTPLTKTLTLSNIPTPVPSPNEILIKISHSAFTPSASNIIPSIPPPIRHTPSIPELEFSGRIAALGSNISSKRPDLVLGAAVFGSTSLGINIRRGLGTLAEYVPAPAESVALMPAGMGFGAGAALSANGITALQVLDAAGVKAGDKVFVNGGSGGTGSLIVQVVRERVGRNGVVVSCCSGGNVEMVKGLGVDEVIDYHQHTLHEYLAKEHTHTRFDAIIDTIGIQELYTHSPAYLREGGKFVNIGAMKVQSGASAWFPSIWSFLANLYLPAWLGGTPRSYQMITGTPNARDLERVRKLVEEGKLKPVVDSVWGMEDVLKAYERLHSQRARGKVVVQVDKSDV